MGPYALDCLKINMFLFFGEFLADFFFFLEMLNRWLKIKIK